MTSPQLDTRTQEDIYAEALALARQLTPEWALGFGPEPDYFSRDDAGLAMLQLFGELHLQLTESLNSVPNKYQLAFWDFMGMVLRPPKAAEAPLCFKLAKLSSVLLPAGTQIASASDKAIVFETAADVTLLPATIKAAFAVRPDADAYADYTSQIDGQGTSFPLFSDDPDQEPIVHALYLCDPTFNFNGASGRLTFSFEGVNLAPEFFSNWSDGKGAPLTPIIEIENYDQLTISFSDPPDIPETEIDGLSGNWICTTPAEGVRTLSFESETLPRIYLATARINLDAIAADKAYFNAVIIDLKKGGQPFGKTPDIDDAFYLASKLAFARSGALISIDVGVQAITPSEQVDLNWEYWDGKKWSVLEVNDSTSNFTRSGEISFICPPIVETKINNVNNYWIRSRIDSGGYGKPQGRLTTMSAADVINDVLASLVTNADQAISALEAQNLDFGYEFKPATYTPPFIDSLSISSETILRPSSIYSQNGFNYEPLVDKPYQPASDPVATFYLGFSESGFAADVAGQVLTIYIAFENEDPSLLPSPQLSTGTPDVEALCFEYFDGNEWQKLTTAQLQGDFQTEGILALTISSTIKSSVLFGQSLYWIRLRPPLKGENRLSPVRGIFPNTVPAFNSISWEDVILGSSTGEPSQTFQFPHKPVLDRAQIQILESAPGTFENGQDIVEVWTDWQEVSNFDFATPFSKYYTIDHASGVLTFGNGVKGSIPPKAKRNIKAKIYFSGGGASGNKPIGDLKTLKKANSSIASVSNVEVSVGGVDADTTSDMGAHSPAQVRSGGRAVTLDDYVALALTSSQDVVRAAGSAPALGTIEIVILPHYQSNNPAPSFDLRDQVNNYLSERCLPMAASLISVTGPDYKTTNVNVQAFLLKGATYDSTLRKMTETYMAFLQPLTGGVVGKGWDFGATIRASDLANLFSSIPGVMMIDGVALDLDLSFIQYGWNQLPDSGVLTLEVLNADSI